MEALATREFVYKDQYEKQVRYDLVTQFSELVDGNMRTSFELSFDGSDLYGPDGRGMNEVTINSLNDAEKITELNPNLGFELRRRAIERDEYRDLLKMSRGALQNTMVVVSDFPEELIDAKEDVGGYNVTRKQTMLRVLIRKSNGNIQMYSQNLDGSNRSALEAIYSHFDLEPEAGELLGQRINLELSSDRQSTLVDELVGVYDRKLTAQYGGEWYGGRRPADLRNTYDFVCSQTDLIEHCVQLESQNQLNISTIYDVSALMQDRFKAEKADIINIMSRLSIIDRNVLGQEIEQAGNQARQTGRSFSACGVTLRADGVDGSIDGKLGLAGYGNETDSATKYKFNKKMHCVVCQPKAKKDEPKKMCGPCGICRTCDDKLGSKG